MAMDSPECHSRPPLPGQDRLSFCAHPRFHAPGQRVWLEVCQVCRLRLLSPPETFRPYPPLTARERGPCVHLGNLIGMRECQSCRGHVRLKVFNCNHENHNETT